ncbi:MAB_1171c family putative transporter [Amycolatopsis sp. RTGN1]|uniref:MAB_1171c family putative transporter n=1 Tax=Amycolatopsis ponsaeliensis TaxID=2992142 RepID=UPI00254A7DF7|nr:MAB_1171c family putative transporter [Amycolatopsis sp. RTGN1]
MGNAIGYTSSVLALAAAIGKAIGLRGRRPTASQWFMLASLGCIGTALALTATPTLAAVAFLEPFPQATRLLGNVLAMCSSYSIMSTLGLSLLPRPVAIRRIRIGALVLGSCVAAMAALLTAADVRPVVELNLAYAHDPLILGYELIYFGFIAFVLIRFLWLMRTFARSRVSALLRVGVRIDMAAAVTGMLWIAWKVTTIISTRFGTHLVDSPASVSEGLAGISVGLMAIGLLLPTWGARLARSRTRCRTRRALTGITPLWTELTTLLPQVVFPHDSDNQGITAACATELHLYTKVVAIRDAMLILRPYVRPDLHRLVEESRNGQLADQQSDILLEAAALATAIDAYRDGNRQLLDVSGPAETEAELTQPSELLAEAGVLIRVAKALRGNPFVQQLRAREHPGVHHLA